MNLNFVNFSSKAVLCVCFLVVLCSAQQPIGLGLRPLAAALAPATVLLEEKPQPYQFGFNAADEFGTQWTRQETADENGAVKGSYSYKDATGLFRTVEYLADDINGFRANVRSNEPGLESSAPAGVVYNVGNRK